MQGFCARHRRAATLTATALRRQLTEQLRVVAARLIARADREQDDLIDALLGRFLDPVHTRRIRVALGRRIADEESAGARVVHESLGHGILPPVAKHDAAREVLPLEANAQHGERVRRVTMARLIQAIKAKTTRDRARRAGPSARWLLVALAATAPCCTTPTRSSSGATLGRFVLGSGALLEAAPLGKLRLDTDRLGTDRPVTP